MACMVRLVLLSAVVAIVAGWFASARSSRDAEPNLCQLQRDLRSDDTLARLQAAERLGQLGPRALPSLIECLGDDDRRTRDLACLSLSRIGPAAAPAVPALIRWLEQETDSRLRNSIIATLCCIGPGAVQAVSVLERGLEEPNAAVRELSCDTLGAIGGPAVPALVRTLQSGDASMRKRAALALAQIGPDASDAIAPLMIATRDLNPHVRRA